MESRDFYLHKKLRVRQNRGSPAQIRRAWVDFQLSKIQKMLLSIHLPIGDNGNPENMFKTLSLRKKCPNTEFFLVRIFLYLDWISPNTGKWGPGKTPYLDIFCAVFFRFVVIYPDLICNEALLNICHRVFLQK